MASKFGFAGGIPERKVRPIWDAIDSRQFKNALKHVTTLLAKHPNSPYVLALKALVLERMGKIDDASAVSLTAKENLFSNDLLSMDDLTLSTLQIVFQRLDRLDLATECYEHACGKFPNKMELMMGLFNCYVREYSFVKQQQTAIKMYKLAGEEKYLLWSVCSIHLQVLCGNGGDKLLVLAEGLLKKHVASHSLHEPEALMVYISILEQQAKFGDALEILSGKLGSLLTINVDKLRMQGRLLALAGDYTAAADIFHKILESCPDDWEGFLHYLGCLLEDGSIWCDEAVNDPVHPPKFVSCKVSHLTDEQFDSRISIASAFIRKLQTDTVDNSVRGPYLATIEIERRRHLRGKGNDNNLMDGIVQYFCRFGHLGCFTSDVEMFFEVFTTDKKAELSEKLMKINDTLSTPPTKTLGLSISLFKIKQQLLLGDMFNSSANDVEVSCVQMFEMYCKNIPLSKDLDPQESMHGEELLSITSNILVQLFWRTKNVGYLVEAVMVLEFGLSIRRYVSQYKILLLHLYCHFGALSVAHEWYKSLDVKNILMESMLHHILPQMLVSPLWTELNSLLKDYLKFMDDHFRESADLTFLAYHHKNYSKIIEFVQFKDRLQRSSQYLVTRVETPILQLKQNADNIEDEEGILQSMKCGVDFLELSNEIGSKSLTFNEDLESRPWWTPTVEKNYLLGPFQGISYCPKEILTKERETSLKREIEKKSLLPRMIYLSIQSASLSIKEHVEVNGSVKPDITLELKLLLERFSQFLGFSLSEAIEVVKGSFSNGERSVVSDSNLIDWLNFTVFLNAWNLSSRELVHPDRNEGRPIIWNILDSLLERYILENVRSMEPQLCSPCSKVQLLMQLVTEPLAWHGLVIQSCLRSCLPSSKKKKKSGSAYQSSSNLAHAITESVQQLSLVLEGVIKQISESNRRPEDENSDGILSLLRKDEHNDGPGRVFHVLETFISSMSNAEVGDRIYHSLKSWSPADVARKMMTGKLKVLTAFSAICESKLKLLQSLKQQIAQV
ncbi:putative tetratricopeptide-like helical domain, N-acetyltransferase B complex, non-catalytic subunit [Medicago truncatula]|uniref:N-acetyltransferase B complex (NatB) non catalytic subunit n=1 Tax=Medicago truncatula TaxID=3880 RepID=A0A072UXW6_MEDTR|nr:N-terminal acetyltransferase B complex auxiliary subunit NAA25 [Medicago truncatula]KEH34387.1 N-acetyltransferase B complex (NatB) non catalytic subunit [Medicago truncatula]RHN67777.1 putative tetratricopeptide-like helical domain, N-acetyltransferase B complex, non-catalytic subunit [Medicago truncatula]